MTSRRCSSIAQRRAELVVQCACEILGCQLEKRAQALQLQLQLTVKEFERELRELRERYGASFPELVMRSDSAIERARLNRRGLDGLPQVLLRMRAPKGKRSRRRGK
jgi:cytochrome P450